MMSFRASLVCAVFVGSLGFLPAVAEPNPWTVGAPAQIARAELDPQVFGPLRLGLSEAEVKETLGAPQSISRRSMMMTSDELSYTWDYSALQVTVFFSAFDESSPGEVMAIRAKSPCDWAAYGGLKVGMSIDSASKILKQGAGPNVSPLGSVGTEMAGLYFQLSETAVAAKLEMGMISVLYVGPNLP